jgi:sporulation protein YlmC with PRC-barrel domain
VLASEFNGKEVYAAAVKSIGTVKDLIVDPQSYNVTDLVVSLQKDAARRIFGKRFAIRTAKVRIPVSAVDKIGDSIILRFTIDQLEQHLQKL